MVRRKLDVPVKMNEPDGEKQDQDLLETSHEHSFLQLDSLSWFFKTRSTI